MVFCRLGVSLGLLALALAPTVAAAREFPDTSDGIFVFDDQLDTSAMTDGQFAFAATHEVGTQKIVVSAARRLRQINPNYLVLHYRLGQALGRAPGNRNCQLTSRRAWLPMGSAMGAASRAG